MKSHIIYISIILSILSNVVVSFQLSKRINSHILLKNNIGNGNVNDDNVENALNILKEATFNRKGEVQNINNAFDIISSNRNHKLLTSDISQLTGDYELVYSALLPFGFFPITEKCQFLPDFKLTSSFFNVPLGGFEGITTIVSKTPAEISFYNKLFKFGIIEVPIKEIKEKFYRFLHIDKEFVIALSMSKSLSSSSGTLLKKII